MNDAIVCAQAYLVKLQEMWGKNAYEVRVVNSLSGTVCFESHAVGSAVPTEVGPWQIQRIDRASGEWRNLRSSSLFGGCDVRNPIDNYQAALHAAEVWRKELAIRAETVRVININTNQEAPIMATPDLNKPLNLNRTTLLKKLEENLAAEVAKRNEAEAEQTKSREEILALIAEFTPDELYNIFRHKWIADVEGLKYAKEKKTWVTEAIKPTKTESDLEKFVRVLGMTDDKTVEVLPSESLYAVI